MTNGFQAPRLVLSLQALAGASLATRDRMLDLQERYREPESLAVTIAKALDAGAAGILAGLTPRVRAALDALGKPVPLYVMVPALGDDERGERAPELDALIARDMAQATGGGRARAAVGGLPRPLVGSDWSARLGALVELELSPIRAADRRGVVLDAWIADVALAAGNRRLFERFVRMVRRRFKAAAGIETNNLGLMLQRLREWELQPDLVIGPVNPAGLRMKPSVHELLGELDRTQVAVIAKDLRAGGVVSIEEGIAFARDRGVHGLAPDLSELDDVPGELKAMMGPPRRSETSAA